jgi:putative CocE/NonD family hydrolase
MRSRVLTVLLAVLAPFAGPSRAEEPPPLTAGVYRTGYVRGPGCSAGTFDVFEHQWAVDGLDVVEWAARQSWSNGHVGMYGTSMPAIMSLYVAALRPPHLDAIAPAAPLSDLYRDVAYMGGLFNATFPAAWSVLQKAGDQDIPLVIAADGGDTRCLGYSAAHNAPDRLVVEQAREHPYDDAFWARGLGDRMADVTAAVLSMTSWQDEQVSSRVASAWTLLDPARSWHVMTNGDHGASIAAPGYGDLEEAFFDHFVAGLANGFDTTPHVQVWHELDSTTWTPGWVTTFPALPVPAPLSFLLTPSGGLVTGGPAPSGSVSYAYPGLSSSAAAGAGAPQAEGLGYSAPSSGAAFTSAAFTSPVELFGSASADLWVSSTATDTDLQVTLSEIRADGQEEYVQRGWLRASHRALDTARSTTLLPYHPHTAASAVPLAAGVPTKVRLEVLPFGHVFRAGSRLRMTVEAPTSVTGLRAFQIVPAPAVNTVWTGVGRESRLVVGTLPATGVPAAYPACGSLVNQPCRNPV